MSNGELSRFTGNWLPKIEEEMRTILDIGDDSVKAHYGMMRYHLGWADEHFQPSHFPSGKRLRPMLCLLSCVEVGGDPTQALPAAAAIEILHNFSLIHDDVEDADELRRHRLTVWKQWGIAQAINVGDGMFALAFAAMQRLSRRGVPPKTCLDALEQFTQTCLALTEGQYLDISFEQRNNVTVDEYMRMIQGKTAALLGASLAIGALLGGATPVQETELLQFGQALGLAFQIRDDILGIWGDPETTGKGAGNDVLRRKKSLPLIYGLNHEAVGEEMRVLFAQPIRLDQLAHIMSLLEQAHAREFAEIHVQQQHGLGTAALYAALGERANGSPLIALADGLLHRKA